MGLTYKVHCDDFHSNVEVHGKVSEEYARVLIADERRNGYDVTNVMLDGKTFTQEA